MLLQHHLGGGEHRFTGTGGLDQLWLVVIGETKQADRGVHRGEQGVVVAIEGDELLEKAEQFLALPVFDMDRGHITTATDRGLLAHRRLGSASSFPYRIRAVSG